MVQRRQHADPSTLMGKGKVAEIKAEIDVHCPDAVAVDKRLVLDLDAILTELDPAYPTLDNVEAMSFGPALQDGRASLVLVSDNNFGPTQRTAFFAFAFD